MLWHPLSSLDTRKSALLLSVFLIANFKKFFLADSSAKMFKNLCFVLRECHGCEKITRSLDHHLENGASRT